MSNMQVLLLILGFVALTLGSFIWFIATWNTEAEPQLSGGFNFNLSATPAQGIAS